MTRQHQQNTARILQDLELDMMEVRDLHESADAEDIDLWLKRLREAMGRYGITHNGPAS